MNGKKPGKKLPVAGGPRMTYARKFTALRAADKVGVKFPVIRMDGKRFYIANLEPDWVEPQHELPLGKVMSRGGRPSLR